VNTIKEDEAEFRSS